MGRTAHSARWLVGRGRLGSDHGEDREFPPGRDARGDDHRILHEGLAVEHQDDEIDSVDLPRPQRRELPGARRNEAPGDRRGARAEGLGKGLGAVSNRTSRTTRSGTAAGTYDAQDRLLTYGDATYTYTANGELATKTEATGTTSYEYDVLGALLSVTLPDGTQIDYVIDGRSRRVGKKVNGVLVQRWIYRDQLKPVAELDGAGNVVARFVYGSTSLVPDYVVKGGATYRILSDHLGSPRLVVDTATAAVVQRLDYDEFGTVTLDTAPGFQPFGFAGGLYDSHTKLVRFGARDYEPQMGRWIAKDPARFGGGPNAFAYAVNDPVQLVDHDGAQARPPGRNPIYVRPSTPGELGLPDPNHMPGARDRLGQGILADSRTAWT